MLEEHPNSSAGRTRLGHHLNRYTAANTHDYFVHKDLGGFLAEQLDFFIKNEVLNVDDFLLGKTGGEAYERALLRARAVRQIGNRIIKFLAQIEDFQKRLFEKKKFVIETDWCVTLDHVPEELYPTILDNRAQLEQWFDLYAIAQWEDGPESPSEIDEKFLRAYPAIMLDTAFFGDEFKDKIFAGIENVEEANGGILIQGDNLHALQHLQSQRSATVQSIFVDPPYNTGNDGFIYKDSYQHSSWLAMMKDRLAIAHGLLSNDGAFFATIDDGEQIHLRQLLEIVFGKQNFAVNAIWEKKYARQNDAVYFSHSHDHVLIAAKSKKDWRPKRLARTAEQNEAYTNRDDDPRGPWQSVTYTCNKSADQRPNLYYPIKNPKTGEEVWPDRTRVWAFGPETHEQNVAENRLWWGEEFEKTKPRLKVFLSEISGMVPKTIWKREDAGDNQDAQRELAALGLAGLFSTPKPTALCQHISKISLPDHGTILDYFAGSGTTGHAVIDLNREDGGDRKYIMVEMGAYFDTVLRPRIQKVVFAENWKDGVPQFDDEGGTGGVSHIFKYQRLESYEDALNNIELTRPDAQPEMLPDDYMLGYMLDVESRGSNSLLNIDELRRPFDYKLKIQRDDVSPEPTTVDLQETFHYLIGMRVQKMDVLEHQNRQYRISRGEMQGPNGMESTLVVWRNLDPELDYEAERDWAVEALPLDQVDHIYVNGPSGIPDYERTEYVFRERMDPAVGGGA